MPNITANGAVIRKTISSSEARALRSLQMDFGVIDIVGKTITLGRKYAVAAVLPV